MESGKQLGAHKTARNPIPIIPASQVLKKPAWIRAKA
ncbi:MAG: lipoyl synthase, partial [Betaproteobacteria bacterium]|nr:lipoyl synthase [Betaproteobacteria bacterium]